MVMAKNANAVGKQGGSNGFPAEASQLPAFPGEGYFLPFGDAQDRMFLNAVIWHKSPY
jgi:hypothetical protein